jgi:hypothetical protein
LVWFLAAFWLIMVPVGIAVAHFSPISDSHTLPSLTVNKGGVVEFTGDNQTGTTACHDGTVKLSGHDDTVTITGHCGSVDVSGTDIHVTIDSADTIDAGGVGNVIVYHSGTPDIKRSGANVSVSQG